MNYTNFIRSLGFEDAKSMLDPAAYSKAQLEEDLLDLDLDKQHARSMVEQKGNDYDDKLEEAAEAPEWMVDDLLEEADLLEQEQEDLQDEWRDLAEQERLVKSVKSFRRRINAGERDLNISEQLDDNSEMQSELRGALKDHLRSSKQVSQALQLFTDTRQVDRAQNGTGSKDLSKHRKRMEKKKNSSRSGDGARDSDEEGSRDGVGADD